MNGIPSFDPKERARHATGVKALMHERNAIVTGANCLIARLRWTLRYHCLVGHLTTACRNYRQCVTKGVYLFH